MSSATPAPSASPTPHASTVPEASLVTADEINAYLAQAWTTAGSRCIEVGPRWAVALMNVAQESLRPGQLISGPSQFSLADAGLWYAVFTAIGIEPMAVTSELSIRFLRPAIGTQITARCDLHTVGRRTMVGSVSVWTNDPSKPVAIAQGTYLRPN